MTITGSDAASSITESGSVVKKSDASQNFLRAARAGNLTKVLDILSRSNADIHWCNANGLNALHLASKEGHCEVVRELLERGADPNRATKKGNTALHIASLAGQFEVVKTLLSFGANVDTLAQNGFTPLYMAAQENHLEVVKLLLSKNANPALTTDDGFTPLAVALQQGHDRIVALLLENDSRGKICLPALHIAAKKDDVKAANLLLNSDVNVDHQSTSGFTPLHIAAHYGNVNMTELLITRGADVNFQAKNNITPLHVASKWGNHGVAERLIAAGAKLDCRTRDGLTPLHCAARSGHDIVVQLLLDANADFCAKTRSGLNALHMAAQGDHVDAAQLLLQRGLPVDDTTLDFLTALHVASHCGNYQVAKLLLERGCDVDARALNGFTPLHVAAQKNRVKIVELLLKNNAMVEATTESGLTPLHVASFMGHLSIVILLLQHNANPNAPTVRNETTLHLAARAAQTEVARLLLRNGAQVDARARGHQTSLHIAARIGSVDMVNLLLEHSAHVQALTKDTYTPLHLAAKANHKEVCQLLLRANAQLETVTKSGFTPLHLATKYSHPEVTALLLSHRADVNASGRNGLTPLHLATHYGSVGLVRLLLEHNANPTSEAKNGFTPLHIAAEKRLVEVAKLLIAAHSSVNVESRNGFTPLHLACQDGSPEMTQLLIQTGARVNAKAKNGLTPMHLAAQEDSLEAAVLLHAAGSELDARTKAGYTPLHTACHFGQANMVRFLLGKGVDVNAQTCLGSNALHLAAQQGHSKVVYILLESGANPNMRNKHNWTPAHVARRQHYLNIFEVLRQVTTCVESWDAEEQVESTMTEADGSKFPQMMGSRHLLEQPDVMGDHPVTDTEEECAEPDYTVIPASPLFSRITTNGYQAQVGVTDGHGPTVPRSSATVLGRGAPDKLSTMSGEDSIHENPLIENGQLTWRDANDVRDASWSILRLNREYLESAGALQQSPTDWDFTPDNVPIARKPVTSGFLVSFLVDARGGSMRGSRHPGLRVLVPPSAASAPTRITCRMLRPERTTRPPQLNDSEGLACRIIELGPHPCSFNSPVLLEIPHFAALCGRQRELVVLRSDNGEVWREHSLEATDQAVQSAFGQTFDTLETMEELREKRIIRILTNDFPQYLAVVSRLRQETAMVGSDGGVLSSTVVPQVQAVFPEGALQKRIRVGLQAHPIPTELVSRLLGNRVAVSPIVTLEPRRRKFHKPITLTIPLPKTAMRGMLNPTTTDSKTPSAPSLRLLCSITGGTLPAQWEDITGSTPLSKVKDCVSFTTTVSARFWLMDCQSIHESTEMAGHLYREACLVSYMGKLVIFAKRIDVDEALIRCLCVTDDRVDKTLECQEGFEVCAASPEVEVAEGRPVWLEAAGNLLPMTKSGEQLSLQFHAFRENRLAFPVRVRDIQADPVGKFAFMREPRRALGSDTSQSMQRPICTLEVHIGADIGGKTGTSSMAEVGLLSLSAHLNTPAAASAQSIPCVFPKQQLDQSDERGLGDSHDRLATLNAEDIIARSQLDLLQVASEVGGDWPKLVGVLLPDSRLDATCTVEQLVNWITQNEPQWVEARSSSPPPVGGLGGLTVADLRTDHDQALAVLLAWKQYKGDAATGNELNRALRSIGRVDVVKSCMRDIQCVLEEEERTEASKLLNKTASSDQAQLTPPVPTSTSLVGTGTMMSEMEDIPVHEFHSALMAEKPLSTDVDATTQETTADREFVSHDVEEPSPPADEERQSIPEGTADWSGVHISESEEPSDQKAMEGVTDDAEEEHWQSGSPPVTTTSQLGGDPMLDRAVQDMLSATDDADLVRESESMSASMEEPFEPEQEVPEVAESQSAEPPASSSITDTPPGTADHEPKQEETFAQEDITAPPVEDSQTAQQSDMEDSPAVTGYDAPAQEPTPEEGTSVEQPPALHLAGGDTLHSELPVEEAEAQCNAASGQLEEGSPNSPTASQSGAHDEQVDISPREGMRDADQ